MKKFLILSSIIFLFNCSSNRYVITTNEEYTDLMNNFTPNYLKYININSSDSDAVIANVAKLLKHHKIGAAGRYLARRTDRTADDYLLSLAILCMFKKHYAVAYTALEGLRDTGNCLKKLLYADCLSERVKPAALQDIIGEYQQALDCNYSEVNKDIIDIRVKILKYTY
jgi:hypothetical protein